MGSLLRLTYFLIVVLLCLNYVRITIIPTFHNDDIQIGKYWLIEHIGEQLGKAKFHLLEQITISNLLNRTLLLPNVGNSEIGLRLNMSFDHYYQANCLTNIVHAVSITKFYHSIMNINIQRPLNACLVFIGHSNCPINNLSWNSVENSVFKNLSRKFTINKLPPLCFLTSFGWNPPTLPDTIVKQLDSLHSNTDIIITIKESSLFMMDPNKLPVHILQHNQTLINMAREFIKTASPYLAIHWRMEGGPEDGRVCARTLLQTVANLSSMHKFKYIYFATDHPNPTERLKSNSYPQSRSDQTAGYLEIMNKLNPLTYRNISSVSVLTDSGSLSIVEKLICQDSDFFLAGYVPCDRHGSFGREILKHRQTISKKPWLYWSNPKQLYQPEKFYPA
jgi:hypothetical protein